MMTVPLLLQLSLLAAVTTTAEHQSIQQQQDKSSQATAGTWATAIAEISLKPFDNSPTSTIWLSAGNGHGSTNNKIRRYTNTDKNVGPDMTYADSAANGMSITINNPGVYSFSMTDSLSSGAGTHGFSLNGTALTTSVQTLTRAQGLLAATNAPTNGIANVSVTLPLLPGDIIRAHTDGTVNATTVILSHFMATRVS
jgi:hypothetical protein